MAEEYVSKDPRFKKFENLYRGSDYFNPETWDKMPEERRKAMLLVLAEVLGRGGRGNATTPGTPFWKAPQIASREGAAPTTPTGPGSAVRHGEWVIDPDTNSKVYKGDPEYNKIINQWGPSGNLERGSD